MRPRPFNVLLTLICGDAGGAHAVMQPEVTTRVEASEAGKSVRSNWCSQRCGASAESLMQDQIQLMNQLAEAYETKAPEAKINEIKQKLQENNTKLGELKMSADDAMKLADKYKDETTKAVARYMKALAAVAVAKGDFGTLFQGLPDMSNFPMPDFEDPSGGQKIVGGLSNPGHTGGLGNPSHAGTQRIGLPGGRKSRSRTAPVQ
jgi:hypothetical protein